MTTSGAPIAPATNAPMWDWAFYYATHGRPVFPCNERLGDYAKAPRVPKREGGRGHKDATCDLQQIRQWWIRWPHALIGSPVPADQVCIDIDPRKGATVAMLADYCRCDLPRTLAVLSGRMDGGEHLFFYRPVNTDGEVLPLTETKLQKELGEGFDLKTDHGYTILPPSLHPDTRAPYEWRDDYQHPLDHPVDWMPEKLAGIVTADPPRPRRPGDHMPSSRQLQGLIRRVSEERKVRNKVLYWAAMRLVEADYPEQAYDAIADAALTTGLPQWEVNKAINSARKAVA